MSKRKKGVGCSHHACRYLTSNSKWYLRSGIEGVTDGGRALRSNESETKRVRAIDGLVSLTRPRRHP